MFNSPLADNSWKQTENAANMNISTKYTYIHICGDNLPHTL